MNAAEIARRIIDREYDWTEWALCFSGDNQFSIDYGSLNKIIIEEIEREISKEQS